MGTLQGRFEAAAQEVRAQSAAWNAVRAADDVNAPRFFVVTPAQAVASELEVVAELIRDDFLDRFRSWVAWWGDCATLVLEAVAFDVPLGGVRLLAGAPARLLDDKDLASLGVIGRVSAKLQVRPCFSFR